MIAGKVARKDRLAHQRRHKVEGRLDAQAVPVHMPNPQLTTLSPYLSAQVTRAKALEAGEKTYSEFFKGYAIIGTKHMMHIRALTAVSVESPKESTFFDANLKGRPEVYAPLFGAAILFGGIRMARVWAKKKEEQERSNVLRALKKLKSPVFDQGFEELTHGKSPLTREQRQSLLLEITPYLKEGDVAHIRPDGQLLVESKDSVQSEPSYTDQRHFADRVDSWWKKHHLVGGLMSAVWNNANIYATFFIFIAYTTSIVGLGLTTALTFGLPLVAVGGFALLKVGAMYLNSRKKSETTATETLDEKSEETENLIDPQELTVTPEAFAKMQHHAKSVLRAYAADRQFIALHEELEKSAGELGMEKAAITNMEKDASAKVDEAEKAWKDAAEAVRNDPIMGTTPADRLKNLETRWRHVKEDALTQASSSQHDKADIAYTRLSGLRDFVKGGMKWLIAASTAIATFVTATLIQWPIRDFLFKMAPVLATGPYGIAATLVITGIALVIAAFTYRYVASKMTKEQAEVQQKLEQLQEKTQEAEYWEHLIAHKQESVKDQRSEIKRQLGAVGISDKTKRAKYYFAASAMPSAENDQFFQSYDAEPSGWAGTLKKGFFSFMDFASSADTGVWATRLLVSALATVLFVSVPVLGFVALGVAAVYGGAKWYAEHKKSQKEQLSERCDAMDAIVESRKHEYQRLCEEEVVLTQSQEALAIEPQTVSLERSAAYDYTTGDVFNRSHGKGKAISVGDTDDVGDTAAPNTNPGKTAG